LNRTHAWFYGKDVLVADGVAEGGGVFVSVGVAEGVGVFVGVWVGVGVFVGVFVGVAVFIGVAVGVDVPGASAAGCTTTPSTLHPPLVTSRGAMIVTRRPTASCSARSRGKIFMLSVSVKV